MPDTTSTGAAFHETIDARFRDVLALLKRHQAELQAHYVELLQEEYLSTITAVIQPEPNFRNCPRAETHKVSEQMRVITTAIERIEQLELPANLRMLDAERRYKARVEEIEKIWPTS